MRTQCVLGHEGAGHELGALRLHALVDVGAEITVWPPVETAVANRREVVGHEIAADLVAFVDDRPQHARDRLPGKTVRVAEPACEEARSAGRTVDLQDRGAVLLLVHPVLRDVAVRADGDIQPRAVGARDHVLGPVMVARAARQLGEALTGLRDTGVAVVILKTDHGVGVRNVEVLPDQRPCRTGS